MINVIVLLVIFSIDYIKKMESCVDGGIVQKKFYYLIMFDPIILKLIGRLSIE